MTSRRDLGSLHALLVEPSAMQARIIRKACDEVGLLHVEGVGSVADAHATMRRRPPDVVLSALYLPDGSGTGLVTAMRADPLLENVAFILISSETRPQVLDPVRQSGACAILPKPFVAEQLAAALRAALDYLNPNSMLEVDCDLEQLRVLLVDEPVAGMTSEETERTAELLVSLAGAHSVIVVEHDMAFVRSIAKKVTVLHQGSVLAEGTMDEIQANPKVIEVYLGE